MINLTEYNEKQRCVKIMSLLRVKYTFTFCHIKKEWQHYGAISTLFLYDFHFRHSCRADYENTLNCSFFFKFFAITKQWQWKYFSEVKWRIFIFKTNWHFGTFTDPIPSNRNNSLFLKQIYLSDFGSEKKDFIAIIFSKIFTIHIRHVFLKFSTVTFLISHEKWASNHISYFSPQHSRGTAEKKKIHDDFIWFWTMKS